MKDLTLPTPALPPTERTEFDYLMNRFELAAQSKHPAKRGYADARKALFDYVRRLELPQRPANFRQVEDDEEVLPNMDGYQMKCCGCGLVHTMNFRAVKVNFTLPDGSFDYDELDPKDYRVQMTARQVPANGSPAWHTCETSSECKVCDATPVSSNHEDGGRAATDKESARDAAFEQAANLVECEYAADATQGRRLAQIAQHIRDLKKRNQS